MPSKHPRLNLTLDESLQGILAEMSKREERSMSAMAKELIIEALERREDRYFSRLADERVTESSTFYSHEEAWK